jgi:hypothetical protein
MMHQREKELHLLDMADWFQAAALGYVMFKMGRGLYQESLHPSAPGPHPWYTEYVAKPNKTEILHGPVHRIITPYRVSSTAMLCSRDSSEMLRQVKRDAYEKHVITCAQQILWGRGESKIIERIEPCMEYEDIDGYIPKLDEHGRHVQMTDANGEPMFRTYEEPLVSGSGLVERLGDVPFAWGQWAKWRLRYYHEDALLNLRSNTQRLDEDCHESRFVSQFRVEITQPQDCWWPGWRDSLEWRPNGV